MESNPVHAVVMTIKVTINGSEVKNPVARFSLTLAGLVIFLVFLVVLLLLIVPIVWFWALSIVALVFALWVAMPKLKGQYKVIVLSKQKPPNNGASNGLRRDKVYPEEGRGRRREATMNSEKRESARSGE
jgi:hypothetical protein